MSNPQVELHVTINVAETATQGVITLELDAEKAPKSTANFLSYVNSGFYNGTVFQRVIKTPSWKDALEKNQWDEDYMNSAELGKYLKSQHTILKDVLGELGMVKQ